MAENNNIRRLLIILFLFLPREKTQKQKPTGKNKYKIPKQEKSSCNVTTLTMERLIAWLFLRAKRPEQSGGRSGSKIKTRRGQKIKIAHKINNRGNNNIMAPFIFGRNKRVNEK